MGDEDGVGIKATFNYPRGISITRDGNFLITETGNHKVRLLRDPANPITVAFHRKLVEDFQNISFHSIHSQSYLIISSQKFSLQNALCSVRCNTILTITKL